MILDRLRDDDQLRFLVDADVLDKADMAPFTLLAARTDAFAAFHGLSPDDVTMLYLRFLRRHVENLQRFARTQRYPVELDGEVAVVPRVEYELALLMSTLTTFHRHRLMELLHGRAGLEGPNRPSSAVIIGVGPGLELDLLAGQYASLRGYDPHLSAFCEQHAAGATLVSGFFDAGRAEPAPAAYYVVEVLEHLEQPFVLADQVREAAAPGSRLIMTTIRDEPQFDHVYNFAEGELLAWGRAKGLELRFHERIAHRAFGGRASAENEFHVFAIPDA